MAAFPFSHSYLFLLYALLNLHRNFCAVISSISGICGKFFYYCKIQSPHQSMTVFPFCQG